MTETNLGFAGLGHKERVWGKRALLLLATRKGVTQGCGSQQEKLLVLLLERCLVAKDQVVHFNSSRSACLLWTNAFLLSWVPELTAPFSHIWLYPEDELAALVFHFQSGCHTKC